MRKPKSKTEEVDLDEACPCGGGKPYRRCCKKRRFEWHRDGKGNIFKTHKLNQETVDALQKNLKDFEDTFGRKPRKNDRVLFQSYSISDRDLGRQTLEAMKAAGIRPILAYAYRRTQRIVTDPKLLAPDEWDEYLEACDEFDDLVSEGFDPYSLGYPDTVEDDLLDHLHKSHIVGGYFIENHFNKYRRVSDSTDDAESVAAALTINFVRCLNSVHVLIKNDISYDAYNLLRSMYENYLSLKYIFTYPESAKAFLAQLGIELGTHEHAIGRSGDPIQSRIIEKSSGLQFEIPSRWKMASALDKIDEEMYKELYRSFSAFSHSDMSSIAIFLRDGKFDYHNQGFSADVLIKCHLLSLLMFSCLKQNSTCRIYLRRDLTFLCERTFSSLLMAINYLEKAESQQLPDIGWSILKTISESDQKLEKFFASVRAEWDEIVRA